MSAHSLDGAAAERTFAPSAASSKSRSAHGSTPALGDEALIRSIAVGDELALGELYDRFGTAAYRLALRVVRDPGLAEEAVQDAFLSVWRSASKFDGKRGAARSWLLMLVHRRAVDLVKRAVVRREDPVEELPESVGPSTADAAHLRDERRRVRAALDSLPAKQRKTLELAYYGGYSQSEIAEHLRLPLGTVKSRMFAGLSRLAELLREPDLGSTTA